jgi:hypothetical protein
VSGQTERVEIDRDHADDAEENKDPAPDLRGLAT